jgi:ribA/ribD-fused uncharacterized protein
MSDQMFWEVPVPAMKPEEKSAAQYKFGDWQKYAVHSDSEIKGFFGDYRFLSNFFDATVYYEGLKYHSTENAYQAAKIDVDYRHHVQICTHAESKRIWKKFPLMDASSTDWDLRKYDVMASVVFDKFLRNLNLRKLLLETEEKYLEETNHWKDTYWGVDIKKGGRNMLGKILMNTRRYFRIAELHPSEPLPMADSR